MDLPDAIVLDIVIISNIRNIISREQGEICGYLLGKRNWQSSSDKKICWFGDSEENPTPTVIWYAERFVKVQNASYHNGQFAVPYSEHQRSMRLSEIIDRSLVGFVHTHPTTPPCPSAIDREQILLSELPWVIISCISNTDLQNSVAAYQMISGANIPVGLLR